MSNRKQDEIRRALESGDIIAIAGPKSGSTKTGPRNSETTALIPEIDPEDLVSRYNFPIGVEFNKYIPPAHYLLYTQILDPLVTISGISNHLRYSLDILGNLLLVGNILAFEASLADFADKYLTKKDFGARSRVAAAIDLLFFYLSTTPAGPVTWISKKRFFRRVNGTPDQKGEGTQPAITVDQLETGTAAATLFGMLKGKRLPKGFKKIEPELGAAISSMDPAAARDLLQPFVTHTVQDTTENNGKDPNKIPKKGEKSAVSAPRVNDPLILQAFIIFWTLHSASS